MATANNDYPELEILAESENFAVLRTQDLDDEVVYNVEMGSVTLHLFQEEWDELVSVLIEARGA